MGFRTRRKGNWTKRLGARGKALNREKFASEKWFKELWRTEGFSHTADRWNAPVNYFIADLINRTMGFVVEVDGAIHNTLTQKERDARKDAALREMGLKVFRVKAFDMNSFAMLRVEIQAIRAQHRALKK